ncbi:hypothetical protein [Paenibacillus odorifer]|uniref:hypothetical protein n=1 Tax=Paenibacillus odorifer TaxID=189426 RepID=UPI00211641F3|nr:hypothetical protein [Paenibacillus odorifer]
MQLTLPLPTSINDLYINQYVWSPKSKSRVPSGKRILSKEGEKVKAQIIKSAKKQIDYKLWDYEYTKDHFIYMDATIYFNRTGRDDNNIYKLNNDALEKIVYDNDSRILTRTQRILYDKENPRIELIFSCTEYIGIFDNQNCLNDFEVKCKKCKRYKNNCSILKKAKEGRIQEEIIDFDCSSFKKLKNT